MLKLNKPISVQTILIALGITTGICIRLIQLGSIPLNDQEAALALQAFHLANGTPVELSGQPLYLVITTVLFYLFGSTNFLARLVPAISGIFLLLTPLWFRKYLRPLDIVLVVWLIALEPSLVTASRTASSMILALSLAVTMNAAYTNQRKITTGILAGLFLLSGTGFWWIVLADLILLLVGRFFFNAGKAWRSIQEFLTDRKVWVATLVTLVLMGGLAFLIPAGFSAWAKSLPDFLVYITQPSGVAWWMPLVALVVYSTLPVVFGLWGGIRTAAIEDIGRILLLFAFVNLFLILILPGRDVLDLIWVSLPLAFLAGIELSRHFYPAREEVLPSLGISLLVIAILLFLWQIFGRLNSGFVDSAVFWLALGGGIVILVLSAILAVFGWTFRIAGLGYTWGFTIGLFLLMVMGTFHSIQHINPIRMELWDNGKSQPDQALMIQTIAEVSGWTHGTPTGLPVQVVGPIAPSLEWSLRFQESVKSVTAVRASESPAVVITLKDTEPELASQYRGQDFNTSSRVKFEVFQVTDWLRWFLLRKTDLLELSSQILWVRSDLFPGGIALPIISE